MEWGTYKPNQFFGIKNIDDKPTIIGLAWAVPDSQKRSFVIRHTYKYQSNENITAYYEYHDGWSSSRQIIEDNIYNARFEIDFIKQILQDDLTGDITS